jgi:hypothetical protein
MGGVVRLRSDDTVIIECCYSRSQFDAAIRAAIAALREPTEDMRCAGVVAVSEADDGAGESWDYVDNSWAAMIDAALK